MPHATCKEKWPDRPRGPADALYVHVPFCAAKCGYCDFYSLPHDAGRARHYLDALAAELHLRCRRLRRPLESIYVGGGTPTCLAPEALDELLGLPGAWIGPHTEFTVEVNPGTLDDATAAQLVSAGVNRVTVGAQSFEQEELEQLGRSHSATDIARAVTALHRAGMDNVALDLIYGIPRQTPASWRRTLDAALAIDPSHLSVYALSYEPQTPLAAARDAGRVVAMDDETQRDCYDEAIATATAAGLDHYELSNFARPNRTCRHNLTYWLNRPYIGLGPAAASYVDGVRSVNEADLAAYTAALTRGETPPHASERLTGRAAMAEALMLGLRLIEGVGRRRFADRYGTDPLDALPYSIGRHVRCGALALTPDRLRVSPAALFVCDTIFADILAEARQERPRP
ncbi:MAG: radical SAM family heme chaperone HemW [Phycisphaerae bacterium]|nr:radical SAM family heme chaperone HemW [Phycisphaerae bacterium]